VLFGFERLYVGADRFDLPVERLSWIAVVGRPHVKRTIDDARCRENTDRFIVFTAGGQDHCPAVGAGQRLEIVGQLDTSVPALEPTLPSVVDGILRAFKTGMNQKAVLRVKRVVYSKVLSCCGQGAGVFTVTLSVPDQRRAMPPEANHTQRSPAVGFCTNAAVSRLLKE
jgi:hypothetical protein